jgi:hypothetical protein
MNLFKINTTAFEEEDFYLMTDLQEQDITEVINPIVMAERDSEEEEYDNDMIVDKLKERYPNNVIIMYNGIETLTY